MRNYLRSRVLFSSWLVGVSASAEFWVDQFGLQWWYLLLAAFIAAAANLMLLGHGEQFKKNRQEYFLDLTCGTRFAELRKLDPTVRINIMATGLLFRRWWPRQGLRFFKRYGFEDNQPDVALTLELGQGVAGTVLKDGVWAIGSRHNDSITIEGGVNVNRVDCNMNDKQRAMCKDLQLFCSYPVRQLQRQGLEVGAYGPIIGVVNIDSQMPWHKWDTNRQLEHLVQRTLPDLAIAAANILD